MAQGWTAQDKQQIAVMLKSGFSASQIAERFEGRSREGVVGLVNRDEELREIGFVRVPGPDGSRTRGFVPLPKPSAGGPQTVGRPIHHLPDRGRCKFPVNSAKPGEVHLFCGLPSDGSWCAEHHGFVFDSVRSRR